MNLLKRIGLAENNLERVNMWIANSDSKIGIALAFQAILPGFLSTKGKEIKTIITLQSFDFIHFLLYLSLALFVLSIIRAIYYSFKALFPDIATRESSLFFFGSIVNQGLQKFKKDFSKLSDVETEEDLNNQVFINSQIAVLKFSNIKRGIISTFYASILWLAILILISWLL